MPIYNPAPLWQPPRSEYIELWHGCTERDKANIEQNGVDLAYCRVNTDFGRGFYTTTQKRQAEYWAVNRLEEWKTKSPVAISIQAVVLRFRVGRYSLSSGREKKRIAIHEKGIDKLRSLAFAIGDADYEDYWSLVQYCRQSTPNRIHDHLRSGGGWYDLVSGPVAAFWDQRVAMDDSDQFSFHTKAGIGILNALIQEGLNGNPDLYRSFVVP